MYQAQLGTFFMVNDPIIRQPPFGDKKVAFPHYHIVSVKKINLKNVETMR